MPDDGIGTHLVGMLQHQLVGFLAGILAKLGEDRDISTKERLDATGKIADHTARADGDTRTSPRFS